MTSEGSGYWAVLEPYWERIDIYSGPERFLQTYAAAPPVVQVLFASHFCESEVSNGGLHQFFSNPTGVLAPEAEAAFGRIGLNAAADVLRRAMAFFGEPYPRDQAARLQALPDGDDDDEEARDDWDPFRDLDDQFYESLGRNHEPFHQALDRFAKGWRGAG